MSRAEWVYGACLGKDLRNQVLGIFVNRFTGEHRPAWVTRERKTPIPDYPTDLDWLHNTQFAITKRGRLDQRVRYCISHPMKRPVRVTTA